MAMGSRRGQSTGRAAARGHSIRTGLEDTPVLPDGHQAVGNGELVPAPVALLAEVGPVPRDQRER